MNSTYYRLICQQGKDIVHRCYLTFTATDAAEVLQTCLGVIFMAVTDSGEWSCKPEDDKTAKVCFQADTPGASCFCVQLS